MISCGDEEGGEVKVKVGFCGEKNFLKKRNKKPHTRDSHSIYRQGRSRVGRRVDAAGSRIFRMQHTKYHL